MNMEFERKLIIPMEVKKMYPLSSEMSELIHNRDMEIKSIFSGKSDKKLLIIGPCSADSEDSVIDYVCRLGKIQEAVCDKLIIIPRVYTNKPRTSGSGYKGLLHQPDPDKKPDVFKGITATRELHIRAVSESGLSCADELLYPENYRYLDDLLGYVTVGARSVDNQQHRLTASGIDVPVGMKNPLSGDLSIMLNAVSASQQSHSFIYRGWAVHSHGNPYSHCILRGYTDSKAGLCSNYEKADVLKLMELYKGFNLENPSVIIDVNHANSGKDPFRQPEIIDEILAYCKDDKSLNGFIKGFMVESYIEDGAQKIGDGIYGKSITDPCLGWDKTEKLILNLAEKL